MKKYHGNLDEKSPEKDRQSSSQGSEMDSIKDTKRVRNSSEDLDENRWKTR